MKEIKKLLICADLNDASESVIEYGLTLGLMLGAHVKCIHISRPLSDGALLQDGLDIPEDFAKQGLEVIEQTETLELHDYITLNKRILAVQRAMKYDGKFLEVEVISDFALPGILNESKKYHADMIIIGAEVNKKDNKAKLSFLAREIIEKSNIPVVIVPSSYTFRNLDKINVFISFEFEELSMIMTCLDMAIMNQLKLSCIHILTSPEEARLANIKMEVYKKLFYLEEEADQIEFRVRDEAISPLIKQLTDEEGIDLLVMRTNKRHWNLLGFKKDFADQVLENIRVPLMAWKNNM